MSQIQLPADFFPLMQQQWGSQVADELCASLSGSMDIASKERKICLDEWRGIFGFDLNSAEELRGTKHDIFALSQQNYDKNIPFPKLYTWCGKEDALLGANRNFDSLLTNMGIEHLYEESEGDHSWRWWDLHIQSALKYLLK